MPLYFFETTQSLSRSLQELHSISSGLHTITKFSAKEAMYLAFGLIEASEAFCRNPWFPLTAKTNVIYHESLNNFLFTSFLEFRAKLIKSQNKTFTCKNISSRYEPRPQFKGCSYILSLNKKCWWSEKYHASWRQTSYWQLLHSSHTQLSSIRYMQEKLLYIILLQPYTDHASKYCRMQQTT